MYPCFLQLDKESPLFMSLEYYKKKSWRKMGTMEYTTILQLHLRQLHYNMWKLLFWEGIPLENLFLIVKEIHFMYLLFTWWFISVHISTWKEIMLLLKRSSWKEEAYRRHYILSHSDCLKEQPAIHLISREEEVPTALPIIESLTGDVSACLILPI